MGGIASRHLFDVDFELGRVQPLGQTPAGARIIVGVTSGTFEGERLRGRVLAGGGDWALVGPDGTVRLDVRGTLETDDGALIYVTYCGRWRIPPELAAKVMDPAQVESVDASAYYLRTLPVFETGAPAYAWLNSIVAVGIGRRTRQGVSYAVHEVL
jgi:hypothetical protein